MKPELFSSSASPSPSRLWVRQLCLLGGMGLWGGSLALVAVPAWAEPEVQNDAPQAAESAPPITPVETSAESLLRPQVSPAATEAAPAAPAPTVQAEPTRATPEGSSVFIDPTDYSLGATPSPDSPSLVFSDRSTGCQFTLEQGKSSPTRTCGSANPGLGNGAAEGRVASANGDDGTGFSLGPVSVGGQGLTVGGTTVISREYFNQKFRPLNLLRRGAEEFVFPLAMPAPITSLFGWRQHPIFGDRRFHTGTDLGAPEGTPVLATKDGKVSTADYLGGYGLTVILSHNNGTQETRYAHLSQILVRPGETVQQGDVVGLVGSTGNSTGPHLHFELRELTAQGWVLVDPNELMNYAVANLVDALNNPLQALGLGGDPEASDEADALLEEGVELPYRPAQPNAS